VSHPWEVLGEEAVVVEIQMAVVEYDVLEREILDEEKKSEGGRVTKVGNDLIADDRHVRSDDLGRHLLCFCRHYQILRLDSKCDGPEVGLENRSHHALISGSERLSPENRGDGVCENLAAIHDYEKMRKDFHHHYVVYVAILDPVFGQLRSPWKVGKRLVQEYEL
jgi:hypothetical protein